MAQGPQIASIQLSQYSNIRLNGFPSLNNSLIDSLRIAIESGWTSGIISITNLHGAVDFWLHGSPWQGHRLNGVRARGLLMSILKCMTREGWSLIQTCDITSKTKDKDILFFEYDGKKESVDMFSVSFNRSDRLRLILPNEFGDEMVMMKFTSEVASAYPFGVSKISDYYGATELILKGSPWLTSSAKESIASKLFLCQLLAIYRAIGYKLYASVDISTSDSKHYSDKESWVFRKVTPQWGN